MNEIDGVKEKTKKYYIPVELYIKKYNFFSLISLKINYKKNIPT